MASLLAAAALGLLGSLSDISLGDECAHVRHARAYLEIGTRVPRDPLFARFPTNPVPFNGTPLWHAVLAALWYLTGRTSQTLAQAYQAGFYLLLVLSVYFGARRLWGLPEASWAWLVTATTPMVCAYSILLYQDVPGAAVSAMALLLLWRRRFFWTGVALAAAYLMKMNMLVFAPWAVVFAVWLAGGSWKHRLACAVLVGAPVAAAFAYDMGWRLTVYGDITGYRYPPTWPSGAWISKAATQALMARPKGYATWKPFPVSDLRAVASHLGLPLLFGLLVAPFRARDFASKWLWGGLAVAVAGFAVVFLPLAGTQIRYLFPIVPVVGLLVGRAVGPWRFPRWLKIAVVAGCVLQAAAATAYVSHARQISEGDKAAYAWMREHARVPGRIMFPEQVLVNQTGRTYIWEELNPAYFMAEADDAAREEILRTFGVTHIAVPLRRLYDRRKEGDHAGGYARDFVESLEAKPYLSKVYANPEFLVFEVAPPPKPPRGRPPIPADPATAPPASGPAGTPGR
ncbi:MAG: glycosyltransferase family 39 protein [Planctomycetes bacterium]|nr:glycosyltransferase family 39 protein [Planctomycetota bacterium]